MKKIFLSFEFEGWEYHSILKIMKVADGTEYHITILDWELERLLYGNHIIKETGGRLQVKVLIEKKEQTKLKLIIASLLSNHLNIPCFVGEQRLVAADHGEEGWEHMHPMERHKSLHPEHMSE